MQLKVLFIDDSKKNIQYLKSMFYAIGNIQIIGQAFTRNEAEFFLKSEIIDLVIMDVFLRNENVLDLVSFIKNNYKKTEIIVLSNYADIFYKKKCKSLGAFAFFDKSYEFEKIPECLQKIILTKNK